MNEENKNQETSHRVYEIVTQIKYLSEKRIQEGLAMRTIHEYAYIMHDKDIYTEEDLKNFKSKPKNKGKEPKWKIGDLKKKHWHIVIRLGTAKPISTISKWFDVPTNFIIIGHGRGAWLDKVQYLTHEKETQQKLGKRLYTDDEVKANFDFRMELTKRQATIDEYGHDLTKEERMLCDVLYHGKTIRECINEDKLLTMKFIDKLQKHRLNYIKNFMPVPLARINFFISGQGGEGKDLISVALARSLFPQYENDEDIYFEVGANNVTFEGYDGQPVIIWSDARAVSLITKFGRENVFQMFETFPKRNSRREHVKHNSIRLCNAINIVTSVDDYISFLDGLAGEYTTKEGIKNEAEDKRQSYRRFPLIMPLHEKDFELLANKGYLENTNEFLEYVTLGVIRGNMYKVASRCKANEKLRKHCEKQLVNLPVEKCNELLSRAYQQPTEEEIVQILEDFEDFGTIDEEATKRITSEENSQVIDFIKESEEQEIRNLKNKINTLERENNRLQNDIEKEVEDKVVIEFKKVDKDKRTENMKRLIEVNEHYHNKKVENVCEIEDPFEALEKEKLQDNNL